MKRVIPRTSARETTYYDIATPYGYGGPVIAEVTGSRERLAASYARAFADYCRKEHIVAEFIRFHPLLNNRDDFAPHMTTVFSRRTVATDLTVDDPVREEFSKSARKTIRQALREPAETVIRRAPTDLGAFMRIYYDTMERQHATDFYYFPPDYFDELLRLLGDHILTVEIRSGETVMAAGLYLLSDRFIHAHLSGTRRDFLHRSPAYLLKKATAEWGHANGFERIHYGGGTSESSSDSLLAFKKKFTREGLYDFYVGKNIYLPDVYERLTRETGMEQSAYFPQYRQPHGN